MKTLSKSKGVKENRTQLEQILIDQRMKQFMLENPLITDDNIPDAFDRWLSDSRLDYVKIK